MKTNDDGSNHGPEGSDGEQWVDQHELVLEIIRNRTRPIALSDLAEIIFTRKRCEGTSLRNGADDENRVRLRLHHVDLPKLQERGVIEYDPSRRLIV